MELLIGDVGGTKTDLALARVSGEAGVEIVVQCRYASAAFASLAPIVNDFLAGLPTRPSVACFGVPGAVIGGACETPNLPWFLRETDLAAEIRVPRVRLLNDFAAAALGVLALPSMRLAVLQPGEEAAAGTKAVIGAGTGLGQAILVWDGASYLVAPTEAGHADFAPHGEVQRDLAAFVERGLGHVGVERLVSGPGLVRIFDFLTSRGGEDGASVRARFATEDPGAVIASCALAGSDPTCVRALRIFVELYGAEAGNLALRTLATGGVYVAGGIAPKIRPALEDGTFLAAFSAKGRLSGLLSRIPVYLVLEPQVGLYGAALAARREEQR